jgi:hypothetical protein
MAWDTHTTTNSRWLQFHHPEEEEEEDNDLEEGVWSWSRSPFQLEPRTTSTKSKRGGASSSPFHSTTLKPTVWYPPP